MALFLAHVAHVDGVGWSVTNYGNAELDVLFNSKYYFEWDPEHGGYNLSRTRVGIEAAG